MGSGWMPVFKQEKSSRHLLTAEWCFSPRLQPGSGCTPSCSCTSPSCACDMFCTPKGAEIIAMAAAAASQTDAAFGALVPRCASLPLLFLELL